MNKFIVYFLAAIPQLISPKSIPRDFSELNINMKKYIPDTDNFEKSISGKYMEILTVAFNEFKKEQKNISDFEIYIKDNDEEIEVTFVPNFAPGEKILGGKTSLGRSVTYTISKKMRKVIKSNYHR
ncbi:hypothetical protein [Janthinobacterium sp. HLX7-2]|uniref:hypothetical protein n=1 Tax=Janthinobacterium sp. HLX7-2 TaxID=1259331 RepID=UPI003F1F45E5